MPDGRHTHANAALLVIFQNSTARATIPENLPKTLQGLVHDCNS